MRAPQAYKKKSHTGKKRRKPHLHQSRVRSFSAPPSPPSSLHLRVQRETSPRSTTATPSLV
eukprot:scaffold28924_cov146-Isochrysis_galbana.AAC.3